MYCASCIVQLDLSKPTTRGNSCQAAVDRWLHCRGAVHVLILYAVTTVQVPCTDNSV